MIKRITQVLFLIALLFGGARLAMAAVPGEMVSFNVDQSYAAIGKSRVMATLQYVGQNAYFYFENDWWNSAPSDKSAFVTDLAKEFDQVIYPQLRNVLGSEWKPGIDGDPKIAILFTPLKDNAGGFFNTQDEYSVAEAVDSNARELIYLNTAAFNSSRLKGFLAHEFQHLITFYQKDKANDVSDEVFLNEARSEYASTILGYDNSFVGSNLEKRISDFLSQPSNSLTEWRNQPEDYGIVNLFMQYLVEHYGSSILSKMIVSSKTGIESINEALASLGAQETFTDIFANWLVAIYLDDCQIGVKYCFLNENIRGRLRVAPTSTYTFPPIGTNAMMVASMTKDWTPRWFKFTGGNQNLKIDFGGVNGDFKVPYIITKSSGRSEVKFLTINNQEGTAYISNFGSEVASVVLMPFSYGKMAGFAADESYRTFTYAITTVSEVPPESQGPAEQPQNPLPSPPPSQPKVPNYPNGSLIRAAGDFKVYVISGSYKRWIRNPQIFNAYGHFRWESVIEITPEERDWYQESNLVRTDGETRVFEIDASGIKHWLMMSPERFTTTGRRWEAIFIINTRERDLYRTGTNIR